MHWLIKAELSCVYCIKCNGGLKCYNWGRCTVASRCFCCNSNWLLLQLLTTNCTDAVTVLASSDFCHVTG